MTLHIGWLFRILRAIPFVRVNRFARKVTFVFVEDGRTVRTGGMLLPRYSSEKLDRIEIDFEETDG